MKRLFLSLALALGIFAIPLPSFATVQSTVDKKIYQGDGYSTSFSFPYNIYLATDVAVYETVVATSNTTQLTLNTNYSITLTAISGVTGAYTASINLAGGSSPAGALAVGTQLTLLRSLPLTQLINISDYSGTPAATWNQALDRDVIREQQLQEQINRAILAPVNSTAPSGYTLPNPVANAYIGWDATGTFLTNLIAAQPLGPTASPTFAGLTITGLNGIAKYSSGVLGTANADVDYSVPNGVETLTNKTFNTAGEGNVFKINGTAITDVVGSGKVLLGSSAPLTGYTVQGSTTVIPTVSGVPTINNCAKFDANHNLVDNGSTCSGGTGMVYPASAGIPITDTSSWKTSLGEVDGDIIYGTGGAWAVQAAPTWNQSTTGSAAKWTTARNLAGNSVDGSGNVAFANKFIAQGTADTGLSGAQFLGALGTGIVKNTTTTGVLSIASAGTDYAPATSASAILSGNGSGGFSNVTVGTGLSFTGGTLSNTVTAPSVTSNVLFQYSAQTTNGSTTKGEIANTTSYTTATGGGYRYIMYKTGADTSYHAVWGTQWKKISGVSTITIYAEIWTLYQSSSSTSLKVDVGGQNNTVTGTTNQQTPEWKTFTIDVSGLSNGTVYAVTASLSTSENTAIDVAYLGNLIAFGS